MSDGKDKFDELISKVPPPRMPPTPPVMHSSKPLETQVGGSHYKDMAIQPVEFCQKNKLCGIESAVVKYVCRHRAKNGKQDIEKAIHLLQILIELEYSE